MQFYLLDDRLCYTDEPGKVEDVRYIPLDRIPVRALPRGYGPQTGVTVIEDRQVAYCLKWLACLEIVVGLKQSTASYSISLLGPATLYTGRAETECGAGKLTRLIFPLSQPKGVLASLASNVALTHT